MATETQQFLLIHYIVNTSLLRYFVGSKVCMHKVHMPVYIPSSSDPLNTFSGSAINTTNIMMMATIMYNKRSHTKQVNQYASGEVPVISCSCLVFDTLSSKGNVMKLPVRNSKPNGIRVIHNTITPTCLIKPSPDTCWNIIIKHVFHSNVCIQIQNI